MVAGEVMGDTVSDIRERMRARRVEAEDRLQGMSPSDEWLHAHRGLPFTEWWGALEKWLGETP